MYFKEAAAKSPTILMEGAVIERLHRDPSVQLDPHIINAGLIYDDHGRGALAKIYRKYIDIGLKHSLPFIALAPTWRANPERIELSSFREHKNINKDCVCFLQDIRKSYSDYSEKIFLGGLMACCGDAYRPEEAMTEDEALKFHRPQAEALAHSGIDFIMASTIPSVSEAAGIASAIAACEVPYTISFIIRFDGSVLDGTPLHEAVERIDSSVNPKPEFYMINCVHPSIFEQAMENEISKSQAVKNRILGLQGNTSLKSPEELDGLSYVDTSEPEEFAELMLSAHKKFGIKLLGGCCGTDHQHIEEIAKRISHLL